MLPLLASILLQIGWHLKSVFGELYFLRYTDTARQIVMTSQLDERAALVGKFIRLAWVSFFLYQFQRPSGLISF